MGEQFQQHSAVDLAVDQMNAAGAAAARLDRNRQILAGVGASLLARFEQGLCGGHGELADEIALAVFRSGVVGEDDEFFRLQGDRALGGDVFEYEVEDLAGGRIPERGNQNQFIVVQPAANRVRVYLADLAGVEHVHATDNAAWPRDDEIARGDPNFAAGHGGVRKPHGHQGLYFYPQPAAGLFGAAQRFLVRDP